MQLANSDDFLIYRNDFETIKTTSWSGIILRHIYRGYWPSVSSGEADIGPVICFASMDRAAEPAEASFIETAQKQSTRKYGKRFIYTDWLKFFCAVCFVLMSQEEPIWNVLTGKKAGPFTNKWAERAIWLFRTGGVISFFLLFHFIYSILFYNSFIHFVQFSLLYSSCTTKLKC
jgi:hypothetical protein